MGSVHKPEEYGPVPTGHGSSYAGDEAHAESAQELAVPLLEAEAEKGDRRASWPVTVVTLLSLQLGWGLWLLPADYARLGWLPATGTIALLMLLTIYSSVLLLRLYQAVPNTVLFGDIGEAAAGPWGRTLVYWTVYSLDATRCIILHLAATQSLQHANGYSATCLWCAGTVALIALAVSQVKSLAQLGWFLSLGTAAQLFAVVIVVAKLLTAPLPHVANELVHTGEPATAVVAVMNLIFAYGGQFAYVEIMGSMRQPSRFAAAVSLSTPIMSAAYLAVGIIGYWSRGRDAQEIIIFALGTDAWSRVAAGAILFQALAQYLVNLNVWTHNVLTIVARQRAQRSSSRCDVRAAVDHHWLPWLCASAVIIGYSFGISVTLPFFSTLVGLVTSVTYLTCAYTLPCWFTLRLLGARISRAERALCWALVVGSLAMSAVGLASSVLALVDDLGGGEL